MSAIYLLIGCSIPLALGFLIAFIVSASKGQFDDDCTPAMRILMDDPAPSEDSKTTTTNQAKTNKV